MGLNVDKLSLEHEDMTFMKAVYFMSIKDLLNMDACRIEALIDKTDSLCHWLRGIQRLACDLHQKGR